MAWRSSSYLAMMLALAAVPAFAADDDDSFSAPDRSVTLDAPTKTRLGIATVAAEPMQYRAEAKGLGQVLGLDAIAQTDADLTVAESASRASQAALARAQGLFNADTGISREKLEAAQHQAASDQAALELARAKSVAQWGREAPWRDANQRRAVMAKLASGDMVIVRATLPAGAPPAVAGSTMHIDRLDAHQGDKGWTGTTVWSAPADPTVPGRSYYMLVDNAQGLAQGDHVLVSVATGDSKQGAYVPAGAVVIAEGHTWLYIEEKPDYFVRQAVDISHPSGAGYFMPFGVQPGEQVVARGAGHLLARETGSDSD